MGLTEKQRRFAEEYWITPNATQAAIKAGYSARTAYKIGSELLQKTSVKQFLDELREERAMGKKLEKADILGNIENLYQKAESEGDYRTALKAMTEYAKIEGHQKEPAGPTHQVILALPDNGRCAPHLRPSPHPSKIEGHDNGNPTYPLDHVRVTLDLPDNGRCAPERPSNAGHGQP